MFLFYKSMACAVYLQELIIFTLIFHIVAINHYKKLNQETIIVTRKLLTQNPNKITSCLSVIRLRINGYGVTATMITKSKTDWILLRQGYTAKFFRDSKCFMKYSFKDLLWNIKCFQEILSLSEFNCVCHQQKIYVYKKKMSPDRKNLLALVLINNICHSKKPTTKKKQKKKKRPKSSQGNHA